MSGIEAIWTAVMTYGTIFKYLFAKYRAADSGRALPVQKRSTSRDKVTAQSYTTNAGNENVRP